MNTEDRLTPLCATFFMRKEAVLTPNSALKAMASKNPWIRKAGYYGARLQGHGPRIHEITDAMNQGAQTVGPGYALATLKGSIAKDVGKKALIKAKALSPDKAERLSNLSTWEYTNSPFAKALNPASHGIDKVYNTLGQAGEYIGHLV